MLYDFYKKGSLYTMYVDKVAAPFESGYYTIEVIPGYTLLTKHYSEVKGYKGVVRVMCRDKMGIWKTHAWLLRESLAKVLNGRLVAVSSEASMVLKILPSEPIEIAPGTFRV